MPSIRIRRSWRHIECQLNPIAYLPFSVSSCKDKPRSSPAGSSCDFYPLWIVWESLAPDIQIWISRWERLTFEIFLTVDAHIRYTPYCFSLRPEDEIYSAMPGRSSINEFSDILQRCRDCNRWMPTSSPSYFSPSFLSFYFSPFFSLLRVHIYISKIVK